MFFSVSFCFYFFIDLSTEILDACSHHDLVQLLQMAKQREKALEIQLNVQDCTAEQLELHLESKRREKDRVQKKIKLTALFKKHRQCESGHHNPIIQPLLMSTQSKFCALYRYYETDEGKQ